MMKDNVISVSQFLNRIKSVVNTQPQFQNVIIEGELSNFTAHRSGHFYFSLKDENASIRAVMFRSSSMSVKFKPKDGDKVVVVGSLDVYAQTGQMQLMVRKMNLDGLGDLHLEYERLRKALFEKGYFDTQHKKPLPTYPKTIGIITGENTAAHADMARTLSERWPYAQVHYFYSLVQGEYAKDNLIQALQLADQANLDVILIARGGGSIEDLWPFNELELVMAVFEANTPIISGIGHESDTTLVDYVSDYRAATPTAAVVAASPHMTNVLEDLRNFKNQMYLQTTNKLKYNKDKLLQVQQTRTFRNPISLFDSHYMALDLFNNKLSAHTKIFHAYQQELQKMRMLFSQNIGNKLLHQQYKQQTFEGELIKKIDQKLQIQSYTLGQLFHKFDLLNPFKLMKKGYSIALKENKTLTSIKQVDIDDELNIKLMDGELTTKVIKKKELK